MFPGVGVVPWVGTTVGVFAGPWAFEAVGEWERPTAPSAESPNSHQDQVAESTRTGTRGGSTGGTHEPTTLFRRHRCRQGHTRPARPARRGRGAVPQRPGRYFGSRPEGRDARPGPGGAGGHGRAG